MAEFCIDCWNEMLGTNYKQSRFIVSHRPQLCEGCNEYKRCIVVEKRTFFINILKYVFFPIYILLNILYFILRFIMLPYLIIKDRLDKKHGRGVYEKRSGE